MMSDSKAGATAAIAAGMAFVYGGVAALGFYAVRSLLIMSAAGVRP